VVDRNQGEFDTVQEPLRGAGLRRDPHEPIAEDMLAGGRKQPPNQAEAAARVEEHDARPRRRRRA